MGDRTCLSHHGERIEVGRLVAFTEERLLYHEFTPLGLIGRLRTPRHRPESGWLSVGCQPRISSTRLAIALPRSGRACAYTLIVNDGSVWPRRADTSAIGSPAARSAVAWACRSVCHPPLGSPASVNRGWRTYRYRFVLRSHPPASVVKNDGRSNRNSTYRRAVSSKSIHRTLRKRDRPASGFRFGFLLD